MTLIDQLIKQWNIKCIIFDLDGTIIDTLNKHIRAFEILFKEIKIDIPTLRIEENMGRTPKDTLLTLISTLEDDKERLENLVNRKEEILTTLLTDIPILDGTVDLLEFLKSKNLKLCLASSTPKFNVTKMLKDTDLLRFFTTVITCEDIIIGKPDPEVFLKAAKKANFDISHCLIIGDSTHDIEAAKRGNIKIVAVTTGKHNYEEIKSVHPDYIIKSLNELLH
ncbi:MAG: HAD family phosphatase [Candidatus Heimdallarchaeota archaeon]